MHAHMRSYGSTFPYVHFLSFAVAAFLQSVADALTLLLFEMLTWGDSSSATKAANVAQHNVPHLVARVKQRGESVDAWAATLLTSALRVCV